MCIGCCSRTAACIMRTQRHRSIRWHGTPCCLEAVYASERCMKGLGHGAVCMLLLLQAAHLPSAAYRTPGIRTVVLQVRYAWGTTCHVSRTDRAVHGWQYVQQYVSGVIYLHIVRDVTDVGVHTSRSATSNQRRTG